jgi:hypothetical protein
MFKVLFFMCTAAFFLTSVSAQTTARLSGRVYMTYRVPMSQSGAISLTKRYISDFKVIAIPKNSATNIEDIKAHKKNFCANDYNFFKRYHAMVAYSNLDGYFEFKGISQQASYILIFCDRDIQISEVATMNRTATYTIGEKLIRL